MGPSLVRGISATVLRPEERGPPSSHRDRLEPVCRMRADGACIRTAGRERIGRPPCRERRHRSRELPSARSRRPCVGLGRRQRSAAKPNREAGAFPVRLEWRLEDETPTGLEDVPKPLRALRRTCTRLSGDRLQGARRLVLGRAEVAAVSPSPGLSAVRIRDRRSGSSMFRTGRDLRRSSKFTPTGPSRARRTTSSDV